MADNLKAIPFDTSDEGIDFPAQAKYLVREEIRTLDSGAKFDDIYIVWFAYTLGNWKALLSTSRPDGKYYEVTHNKVKNETYVDTYVKTLNTVYSEQ